MEYICRVVGIVSVLEYTMHWLNFDLLRRSMFVWTWWRLTRWMIRVSGYFRSWIWMCYHHHLEKMWIFKPNLDVAMKCMHFLLNLPHYTCISFINHETLFTMVMFFGLFAKLTLFMWRQNVQTPIGEISFICTTSTSKQKTSKITEKQSMLA